MQNLRVFLGTESRCRKRTANDGADSWGRLTRKLDQLKQQELVKTTKHAVDVHAVSSSCLDTFCKISRRMGADELFTLIPADMMDACEKVIQDLQHLISSGLLCKHEFVMNLMSCKFSIPLELVWMLHRAKVFQIATYALMNSDEEYQNSLSSSVLWLLQNSKKSSYFVKIVIDVFASLLVAGGQSVLLNPKLSMVSAANLKKCAENIINWALITAESDSSISEHNIDFSYLSSASLKNVCGDDAVKRFVLTHLYHLLNSKSVPNSTEALLSAVEIQEKTTLDSISSSFRDLLVGIVKALGAENVINEIAAAATGPFISWRTIYLLTAATLAEDPDCCDDFKRLTDKLIQYGLEGGRQSELAAGLLLARQCCSCDKKNFSSYSLWFSSHFGPDSVTARNTGQFQSLLQLLTDIVPVESAEMLRVHINKVPQAPMSCNSILHDYTVLARTRLKDLNESAELTGLFSDSNMEPYHGLESRQGDIIKVLQHFQQTHEVMKPVLEAFICRRSYYHNTFLVELLGLPGSSNQVIKPEDFGLQNDTRHEFISALRSMGKIPDKLFKSYVELRSSESFKESKSEISLSKESYVETKAESADLAKRKRSLQLRSKR